MLRVSGIGRDRAGSSDCRPRTVLPGCPSALTGSVKKPGPDAASVLGDPLKLAVLAGSLSFEVVDDRTAAGGIISVEALDKRKGLNRSEFRNPHQPVSKLLVLDSLLCHAGSSSSATVVHIDLRVRSLAIGSPDLVPP